jgi:hypothetical protein
MKCYIVNSFICYSVSYLGVVCVCIPVVASVSAQASVVKKLETGLHQNPLISHPFKSQVFWPPSQGSNVGKAQMSHWGPLDVDS